MALERFKHYDLKLISSWLVNISAGWFMSIFAIDAGKYPLVLISSILLSILTLYFARIIEKYLDSL